MTLYKAPYWSRHQNKICCPASCWLPTLLSWLCCAPRADGGQAGQGDKARVPSGCHRVGRVTMRFEALHDCAYASDSSLLDQYLGGAARQSGCSPRPPTASRPGSAQWSGAAGKFGSTCPVSYGRPLPGRVLSDDSSELTCGNVCFLMLFFPTSPPPAKCCYC